MAYGPRICACCGEIFGVEEHHLYLRADGCPDDLTVWLCNECHGRAHGMTRRVNIRVSINSGLARAKNAGVVLGRPRVAGDTEERILGLLKAGMGKLKIARTLGVGVSVVQRIAADQA
jgi:hypothetical protein